MKFFKSHSIKYKDYKVIIVPEKFDDIRNDAFKGITPEYIIFSEKTEVIRDFAFSELTNCNIFIPDSVQEIEDGAFDDMGENVTIYCNKGAYADGRCSELGANVSHEKLNIASLIEEQEKMLKKPEPIIEIEEISADENDDNLSIDSQEVNEDVQVYEIDKEDKLQEANRTSDDNKTNVIVEAEHGNNNENHEDSESYKSVENPNEPVDIFSDIKQTPKTDVRCMMFDEKNGISETVLNYSGLSDTIKANVKDWELYVCCKYVDGKRTTSFVTKDLFQILISPKKEQIGKATEREMRCHYCGEIISPDDTFCAMCGRKVKNVVKCPRCNEPNDINDSFCAYCGKKL